ncbi:MAG: hypothetical protein Q8Q65_02645 [bacterium]|nr:hypothetical protein [bacterium]
MKKAWLKYGLYSLAILVLTLLTFGKLPYTFFQQDEWAIIGNYIYWDKTNLDWLNRLFLHGQDTHIIPLANIFSYLQYKLFSINFAPYAWVGIALHFLNAFLVMKLANQLSKNRLLGLIAGVLFLTNSISHQAVTWIATTSGTVTTVTFILLSIISLLRKKVLVSIILFAIALFFKESSVFLFVFLPFVYLLKNRDIKSQKVVLLPLFVLGILYAGIRFFLGLASGAFTSSSEALSQPPIITYVFRLLTLPFKGIAQSIVPQEIILKVASSMVKLGYPQFVEGGVADPYIVQSVAADIVSFSISIVTILLLVIIVYKSKQKKSSEIGYMVLFSAGLVVTSLLPFIIIPGPAGYFSLIDGRHLYVTGIGTSIISSLLFISLYLSIYKRILLRRLVMLLLIFVVGYHVMQIHKHLQNQVVIGDERREILEQIYNDYPQLPDNVIFYIESDKAYYGLPPEETIPPFQSGFGQTLLVWYEAHGTSFPTCFFKDKYLYELLSEDYRYCENRGFGYYRDMTKLREALELYDIDKNQVVGYKYRSADKKFIDITKEIGSKVL